MIVPQPVLSVIIQSVSVCVLCFVEGTTHNSHPLGDVADSRATTTTYETLDQSRQEPVNYQQLPAAQTGSERDYYNVRPATDVNNVSPYEQLDVNTQRPAVYEQLVHDAR